AFEAGLRPGDVIESIDGQPLVATGSPVISTTGKPSRFNIVRKKQRLVVTLNPTDKKNGLFLRKSQLPSYQAPPRGCVIISFSQTHPKEGNSTDTYVPRGCSSLSRSPYRSETRGRFSCSP